MSVAGVSSSKTPKGSILCSVSTRRFPLASESAFALPQTLVAGRQGFELHLVCLLRVAHFYLQVRDNPGPIIHLLCIPLQNKPVSVSIINQAIYSYRTQCPAECWLGHRQGIT